MEQKAKVKVEVDTAPARAKLRELGKEGEAAAKRADGGLKEGRGSALGIGAAAGFGFGLAQRAASRVSGWMPDVISEGTAGFRAKVDDFLGGPEARAARSAREETRNAYAEIIGRQKTPTFGPEVNNYFNNIRGLREITERGNTAIDKEFGGDIIKDAFEGLKSAISGGFDRVVSVIPSGTK
jgi:hypothetical protein